MNDEKASAILDGDISTAWHQPEGQKLPADLTIDLGKKQNLNGFRYHPELRAWNPGIIAEYQFFVSLDSTDWKLVSEGEFSNIRNNPLWQNKTFSPVKARYFKLRALKNTEGNDNIGYGEVDIITN